ncbi:MAG TPA: allantoicase [Streptosporangiaceae bacterium]|nr:allantoicase [Streptosporangiaceae bacterium]
MTPGTDLASRWLGGSVIAASDESFGEKENLLNPAPAAFEPGHYGPRGEIVDGWETRRRRTPGHDWALIRLGAPGVITEVDVDTSFFTGNFPAEVSIEACGHEGYPAPAELTGWEPIVARRELAGDSHNRFPVTDPRRFTHLRLNAYPDGGIARLRVLGHVVPDPRGLEDLTIDLASQRYGAVVLAASDAFYTDAAHLIRPGQARTMGEGWETRRRRDEGHDHVVFGLAVPGVVRRIVVDTAHFKYNASAEVALFAAPDDPAPPVDRAAPDDPAPPGNPAAPGNPAPPVDRAAPGNPAPPANSAAPEGPLAWHPLLARTRLQPDTRHEFPSQHDRPVATVRLDAYPDGGLSRVRLIGRITPEARRIAGYRWFNSLPNPQALQCLLQAGITPDHAAELAAQRPLPDDRRPGPPHGPPADREALTSLLEGKP